MIESGTSEASTGLRATKKRRTFEEILANGVALFRAEGIRGTRTEAIARASAVSPATLFNYFPSKSALAEAWVRGEVDRAIEAESALLEERGLRPALRSICRALAGRAGDAPALRFEAWRTTGRARDRALPDRHPWIQGLLREQQRERIRQDVPARLLAELLLDGLESGLIDGLRAGGSESELARAMQARVDVILDGARKRNERVEAPRAGSGAGSGMGAG
ncbi:MAG: TetR/AcrR family transcriptional regulator [Deltaproteobacteria bacterium]|nr:TetR/AcrR family transcriptional regulator [Deltaproteobacteria bacterium]